MSFVACRQAMSVSLLKSRVAERGVQAAAVAALILSASLGVEASQAPLLGPSDAFGVDYPDAWLTEQAINRFEVQYDGGQWTSVGMPPVYAAVNGIATYAVTPAMPMPQGNHTVSFRACNAGACSRSTSPFAFLVPIEENLPVVATGPVVVYGPVVQLRAGHTSNKCLDVSGASNQDGTPIIQWQCHGGENQGWSIDTADDGYSVRLVSRFSGKCLDVSGASTDDGAPIILWQCHGGANQQWRLEPFGEEYRLVARHSGKCLDVTGWSPENGTRIIQWQCNGGANQTWLIRPR